MTAENFLRKTLRTLPTAPLSEGCTLIAKTLHPYRENPAGFREGGCSDPKEVTITGLPKQKAHSHEANRRKKIE